MMQTCQKCKTWIGAHVGFETHICEPFFVRGALLERVCLLLKGTLFKIAKKHFKRYSSWPKFEFFIHRLGEFAVSFPASSQGPYTAVYLDHNFYGSAKSITYEVVDPKFDEQVKPFEIFAAEFYWRLRADWSNSLQRSVMEDMELTPLDGGWIFTGGHANTDVPFGGNYNHYEWFCPILDSDVKPGSYTNHLGGGGGKKHGECSIACRVKILGSYSDVIEATRFMENDIKQCGDTLFSLLPLEVSSQISDKLMEVTMMSSKFDSGNEHYLCPPRT